MENAVASAKEAFLTWSKTSPLHRQKMMFEYQRIVKSRIVSDRRHLFLFYIYFFHFWSRNPTFISMFPKLRSTFHNRDKRPKNESVCKG